VAKSATGATTPGAPMRPAIDPPAMLEAELVFRRLSIPDLSKKTGISERSLRRYITGESPLPAKRAAAILDSLGNLASFHQWEVHEWLVIRSGATPTGDSRSVPVQEVKIDTVQVDLEVPADQEAAACVVVERLVGKPLLRRSLGGKGLASEASSRMRFWMAHDGGRLRVQVLPWKEHHCAVVRELLRTLTKYGQIPIRVTFPRIDVAVDYAAHPSWIVVQRPRFRTASRWHSSEGGLTYYLGSRSKTEVLVRLYDAAVKHNLPAPRTRVEVELKPRRPPTPMTLDALGGLLASTGPGRAFAHWMTPLYAVELSPLERALVRQGREEGMPWFKRQLAPREKRVLVHALNKLRDAKPLCSPDRVLGWLDEHGHGGHWLALAEKLRADLFYSSNGHRWDSCDLEDHAVLDREFLNWSGT
jgi:hypothetical protein